MGGSVDRSRAGESVAKGRPRLVIVIASPAWIHFEIVAKSFRKSATVAVFIVIEELSWTRHPVKCAPRSVPAARRR